MMFEEREGTLISLIFDDLYKADEARAALLRMEGEGLLEIEEMAIVAHNAINTFRLTQDTIIATTGQEFGRILGVVALKLTGIGKFVEAGRFVFGLYERFNDDSLTEGFIHKVKEHLMPGTSALLLLLRTEAPQPVIERLAVYQPRLLTSDLPLAVERAVREAMDGAAQKEK